MDQPNFDACNVRMISGWFRDERGPVFRGLRDYYNLSEEWLRIARSLELKRHSEKRQEYQAKYRDHERAEYEHWQGEETLKLRYRFVLRNLRCSFVMCLFMTLETQLRAVCRELREARNIPISVSDLKGSTLDQIKAYLTKIEGWLSHSQGTQRHYQTPVFKCRRCFDKGVSR
jgi:hypothetical protein